MSQNHTNRQSDDEEEDLEVLRLAVLQSIHHKKDTIDSYEQTSPDTRNAKVTTTNSFNIPQTSGVTIYSKNNISRPHDNVTSPYYNMPQSRPVAMPMDNFNARQSHDKLDINEPYIPQRVPPLNPDGNIWIPDPTPVGPGYTPYIAHKASDAMSLGVSNVQLSPRSLAFVVENNDILMKRKGENKSPYRGQSPMNYPPSPVPVSPNFRSRWSLSPPLKIKSKSRSPLHRNRPHQYSHRRSKSRSPPPSRQRSPLYHRMSQSRSPPPTQLQRHISPLNMHRHRSRSPHPLHSRRAKSRSPISQIAKHKISPRRQFSRSPLRQLSRSPQPFNGRRRSPLGNRHQNKIRHSPSPHMKRSPGRMLHETNDNTVRHPQRLRSPQPLNAVHRRSISPRPRSHSRSPSRKYGRRSRDRQTNRRRSPYNNGRRRYDGANNGFRNRGRKRSPSPIKDRHRRSRTKSPDRNRRDDKRARRNDRDSNRSKLDDNMRNDRQENKSRNTKYSNESRTGTRNNNLKEVEIKVTPQITNKSESLPSPTHQEPTNLADEKQLENIDTEDDKKMMMSVSQSENENDESSDDDDGIDLFPSDESESENEGRFKSSTSKNERDSQAPTLSFTKLGESFAPTVKDLKDFESTNRGGSPGRNDRDRGRSSYNRRRGDRFRKSDRSGNTRNDRRKGGGSRSNSSRRDRDDQSKNDNKKNDDKPMFKSTFQAVENEVKNSGRVSSERDMTDRKSSSNKRRNNVKETKVSPEKDLESDQITSTISSLTSTTPQSSLPISSPTSAITSITGASSSNNGVNGGKKPIHLRLGAMTNTFKTPKKSSTWSTSEKV